MYSTAGMFVVRGDSPARTIARPQGQAGGVRRQGLGADHPVALCARRARARPAQGFPGASFSTRPATAPPWCSTAAPRRCGAAASAGRVSPRWPQDGGRFIAPTPEEAARIRAKHSFLKAHHAARRQLSGQNAPVALGRLLELRAGAPDACPTTSPIALARALHKGHAAFAKRLAQATRDHAAEHRRGGAAAGADSSGRAEISARNRAVANFVRSSRLVMNVRCEGIAEWVSRITSSASARRSRGYASVSGAVQIASPPAVASPLAISARSPAGGFASWFARRPAATATPALARRPSRPPSDRPAPRFRRSSRAARPRRWHRSRR